MVTIGTVTIEDQWNNGYRGPENRGYRGPEEQWVQRTSGAVDTEDQWNGGYRGPGEQWAQKNCRYRKLEE